MACEHDEFYSMKYKFKFDLRKESDLPNDLHISMTSDYRFKQR